MRFQTLQTLASMFGVTFINLFSAIIMSHGLTPDERGHYLGITMWGGFVLGLCDFGIYMATVYLWGKSRDGDKRDLFVTLLAWALLTGAAVVAVLEIIAPLVIVPKVGTAYLPAMQIYILTSFGGPIVSLISGIQAAESRFSMINLVRIGVPVVLTTCWFLLFLFGRLSVDLCLIVSAVTSVASQIPFVWRERHHFLGGGRLRLSILKQALWYSLRSYGGAVIKVLGQNGNQVFLYSLSPASLAYFQTAASATGLLWNIPYSIGQTSFPRMVGADETTLHEQCCRYLRLTLMCTTISAVLLGLALPVLLPLLFGPPYAASVLPGMILLLNVIFGGLSEMLGNALSSTGRTLHNTVGSSVYVGTMLGGMSLTIEAWGMIGVAISMAIGYFASFMVRFVWYNAAIRRTRPSELVPRVEDAKEMVSLVIRIAGKAKRKQVGA